MLKSYFTIALRALPRNPIYSAVNIAGLSIGLSCCLLISLFVLTEIRVDDFHHHADRLYRLNKIVTPDQGGIERHAITSGLMGPALAEDFPEVEATVRVLPWFDEILFTHGESRHLVQDVVFTDANFFEIFDFRLIDGNPETALTAPLSVVLSESTARRLFGEEDPVGKTFVGLNDLEYTVTGIAEDVPEASHIRFDALVSWSSTLPDAGGLQFTWMNNWMTQVLFTYVLMRPNADASALEAKLPTFMERHFPERVRQYRLYLQSFEDIYLGSADLLHTRGVRLGNRAYVLIFGAVALAVLLIACVNFVNLSTARASRRAREVGVRKVVGATRQQLVQQFVGETILTAAIAVGLALLIANLAMPHFELFTGREFDRSVLSGAWLVSAILAGTLLIGAAAGIYPAFFLSGFRPIPALRGTSKTGGGTLRRGLVVAQFAVSIALITATIIVLQQVRYLESKDLGFNADRVVVLPTGDTSIRDSFATFKQAVLAHPAIREAAGSSAIPGEGMMGFGIQPEGVPSDQTWTAWALRVDDDDLLETYGMELRAGRYLSDEFASDSSSIVVNEALVEALGWTDPIGKTMDVTGEVSGGTVVGVVADFHYESLHRAIEPLILFRAPRGQNLSVRIDGNDVSAAIRHLEKTWNAFEPRYPFTYFFVDKSFAAKYESERRLSRTIAVFASLAIIIACLGISALAAFTASQRTKELGVRKVLGATVAQVVGLLSWDFLRLVVIAFVLSLAPAYAATSAWLKGFAYRVDIGAGAFALAGLIAILIALPAIASHAARAAIANPSQSLRHD